MNYHFLMVVWCLNVLLVPVTILEFRKLHRLLAEAKREATLWEEKARRYGAELELLRGPDGTPETCPLVDRTDLHYPYYFEEGVRYEYPLLREPVEGDECPAWRCKGSMEYPPVEGCTCFQVAPCTPCETNHLCCNQCGWAEGDPLE